MTDDLKSYYIESRIVKLPNTGVKKIADCLAESYRLTTANFNLLFNSSGSNINRECKVIFTNSDTSEVAIEVKLLDKDRYDIRTNFNAIHDYHLLCLENKLSTIKNSSKK